MGFRSLTCDSDKSHQMDECEANSKKAARGASNISSRESRRARGLSSYVPKGAHVRETVWSSRRTHIQHA